MILRSIDTIKAIPAHDLLLLIGDCNAHIETDDALITYYEQTNSNGQLLLDLVLETNMIIYDKHAVSEAKSKAVEIHCRHQRS